MRKKAKEEIKDLDSAAQGYNEKIFTIKSSTSTPSTIKLYITNAGNVINIGFDDYAKCVLPNEWFPSWESSALKAVSVKLSSEKKK